MASGINSTFRQVGIATGIAALGAIFQSRIDSKLGELLPQRAVELLRRGLLGATQSALTAVPPQFREQAAAAANQAFISGLNEILLVGAAIAIVGGLASAWLLVRGRDLVGMPRRGSRPTAESEPRPPNRSAAASAGANPSARRAKTGGVLHELRIENLLLIERAELRLDPGLNAITGETGAGKTVLAHSLDLLMGGRARPQIVRPGADEAWVEGVFALPEGMLADPELAEIAERLPADADEVVLGRRIGASGRTSAFIAGRSASAADLRALGSRLLAFYGQHEHRKLTLASAQLEILDGFAGDEHLELRERYRAAHAEVLAARRASWPSCASARAPASATST